jgi:hypothetical protein
MEPYKRTACGTFGKNSERQKDEADEAQVKWTFWSDIADGLDLIRKSYPQVILSLLDYLRRIKRNSLGEA